MKLRLASSFFLFALSPLAFAHAAVTAPGNCYVGVFGGYGTSNHFNASQFGTAFFAEVVGGPLAVNAFGELNKHNGSFWGAQLGYQAQEIFLNSSQWAFQPAVELEGFSLSKRSFDGILSNNSLRLTEHDFNVLYPMKRTAFLANAILSFNHPCFLIHPYIGFGIGSALIRISNANAAQVNPPEADVNHYNSNSSDATSIFAGQIKLGLSYDIKDCVSIFADYRWLYLANSDFVFGPTVYPAHVETSSWQVKLEDQRYSLVNVGIRLNWS
jgi:opacity protein-like surface antigen